MNHAVSVMLVSRDRAHAAQLESWLVEQGLVNTHCRVTGNGVINPFFGIEHAPDVLILHLSGAWRDELEALSQRPAHARPMVIVQGPADDPEVMRAAIRSGARDYLSAPATKEEIQDAVRRLLRDRQIEGQTAQAPLTAFINSKGGSGATLLACNVAHMMAAVSGQRVALLDLNMQFGTLPLYLDLYPKRGLAEALANLDQLDEVALEGYLAKHASGLKVLGNAADEPIGALEATDRQVERLLELLVINHDRLIVDMPRHIDDVSVPVLEYADQIVIIVQQMLPSLRDAGRLIQVLCRHLALPRHKLRIVVNRYDKSAPVTLGDIETTLKCGEPALIPNDFRTVSDCINGGHPLYDRARRAPITKALMHLEARLGGYPKTESKSLLQGMVSLWRARSS